jgi:hypothetical protein
MIPDRPGSGTGPFYKPVDLTHTMMHVMRYRLGGPVDEDIVRSISGVRKGIDLAPDGTRAGGRSCSRSPAGVRTIVAMPRSAPLPGRDGGARQAHREKLVNLIDSYKGDVTLTPWPAQLAALDAGEAVVVGSWQVLPEFRPPGVGMTSQLRIEPDGRVVEVTS